MRRAYFNTGYIYEFGYGFQSTIDMLYFGGDTINVVNNLATHGWTDADKEIAAFNLRKIENDCNIYPTDFALFEPTQYGTKLLSDYIDSLDFGSQILYWLYKLGAIIYHQMLYHPRLTAVYNY